MSPGANTNFRWLPTGAASFVTMLDAIQAATKSVRLETYIFTDCPLGRRFREVLVQAQARGAQVRVLVDAFGSLALPAKFWVPLTNLGGQFHWFNPLSLRRWAYRNHRKLLVCDERVAVIGGFNIAQVYDGDGVASGWRDLGLQVLGPLAAELADSFDRMFARAEFRHQRLQRLRKARVQVATGQNWHLLTSGPGSRHGEIKRTLARDIAAAQSVQIISAYFLPTWRLRKELRRVCQRGGRVQLILAGKSDIPFAQLASRKLYRSLLRAGVEIYEYRPQVLHAKMIIVDETVYAGSANLDTRSLRINYELLARVADPPLAAEARAIFAADLQQCGRIEAKTWRQSRTFWNKLRESWAYFVLARLDPFLARRQLKFLR